MAPSMRIKAPKLPDNLLKELGVEGEQQSHGGRKNQFQSRKDRRKAERTQKRIHRTSSTRSYHTERATAPKPQKKVDVASTKEAKEPKPILKNGKKRPLEDEDEDVALEENDNEGFDDEGDIDLDEDEDDELDLDEEDDKDGEDVDDEEESDIPTQIISKSQPKISKTVMERLAQDDKEIADLEKKLGIKGRKSLPKSFQEDGLLDLLEGLPGVDDETAEKRKRKSEADEWLAAKRRKAEEAKKTKEFELDEEENEVSELDEEDDGLDDLLEGLNSDEDNDFGGFDEDEDDDDDDDDNDDDESDNDEETLQKPPERVRENPYVAPTTGRTVVKYVPPSKRQEAGSEAELVARIRRQTQGLINRMTESNLLSIIMDFERLYRDNPRQHLTSNIVDLLLIQVCEPTTLPDTLLVLTAGFATGIFKVIGMDFGAQLIQEVIERFDRHYEEAKEAAKERPDVPKQTSNLITFLSELYNFQLVGPNLLFDFIRILLGDLSELNAELLLRIVRIAGPALRQDDPMSVKDIVTLIRPAVAKIGEKNLSVRTKFMIETINDLKNNKMKTGLGASAVLTEHTTKMKKLLGTLKTMKTAEPLRMTLADIRDADKKGKWWLVGASWAGKDKDSDKKPLTQDGVIQDSVDSDDESFVLEDVEDMPDLGELARENQMNTDVRRSIFVSIMSATDYEDAYYRILKLRLNKERQREIPYVIIQCAGAEQVYNPYYTLVAKKLCGDRKIRWSFQDALWKLFRRLGESVFGDDAEDGEDVDAMDMRRLVNIAKLFGAMVAGGSLGLAILKCLNLPYLQTKTRALVEILLITVLLEAGKGGDKDRDETITSVFVAVEGIPELARGLQWFIKKVVRKSDLAGGAANTKLVKEGCKTAMAALEHALLAAEGLVE
ncbi:hypothetical protein NEUTE1DRAFT_85961 [Neurospora tetrasperma FGSC 2508]|uniref:MI domain-containing protein n=1 Tax=Neurospora tetrasperma (strain FGSC 2508 / ATCC MYA-4615 / P0657) TaxID=510951 RepID=F8MU69_NEUT8|nr:uncharacterized protein NEUTE1DRAFT_85961 [Neurospora tetrasperma FGSC 2508]EGO55551.1 hypothetical protein NEUTE1DRAFT_85961 [Neurospora tetrasperma FGSC 2508]EGZ69206.1 hypothetical protein NEUTE2DRAFT_94132 [Neurospora tetrasperma FGSC 2509]